MNSNKLLLVFLTICILILLGYFIKRRNYIIKNNDDSNANANANANANDCTDIKNNYIPYGETLNLKQFSTFTSNTDLFDAQENIFYKKEPYIFIKQSIKEGVDCKGYSIGHLILNKKRDYNSMKCSNKLNNIKEYIKNGNILDDMKKKIEKINKDVNDAKPGNTQNDIDKLKKLQNELQETVNFLNTISNTARRKSNIDLSKLKVTESLISNSDSKNIIDTIINTSNNFTEKAKDNEKKLKRLIEQTNENIQKITEAEAAKAAEAEAAKAAEAEAAKAAEAEARAKAEAAEAEAEARAKAEAAKAAEAEAREKAKRDAKIYGVGQTDNTNTERGGVFDCNSNEKLFGENCTKFVNCKKLVGDNNFHETCEDKIKGGDNNFINTCKEYCLYVEDKYKKFSHKLSGSKAIERTCGKIIDFSWHRDHYNEVISNYCPLKYIYSNDSHTKSNYICQKWSKKKPHGHNFSSEGDHNFCRNPDGGTGPWCYTTNPKKRWEYCKTHITGACTSDSDCITGKCNNSGICVCKNGKYTDLSASKYIARCIDTPYESQTKSHSDWT